MGKRLVFAFIAALAFTALAQFSNTGVQVETDEFEGTTTCTQLVVHTAHNDYLTLGAVREDNGTLGLMVGRYAIRQDEKVFNTFGPIDGDEVLFRFSDDEVIRFPVREVSSEPNSVSWQEAALILVEPDFLRRLFTSAEDVRFRLSPPSGSNYDGTLAAGFLNQLTEFLEECL